MPSGIYNHNKTKTPIYTKERNQKISKKWKGIHRSSRTEFKRGHIGMKGIDNPNFKGGYTPERVKIRNSSEGVLWRKSIFARDNFTCQKYQTRGGDLVAHHINNFAEFPELRFAIDNGITLSLKAHKEFHKIYGKSNNTKEQLDEFLKEAKTATVTYHDD